MPESRHEREKLPRTWWCHLRHSHFSTENVVALQPPTTTAMQCPLLSIFGFSFCLVWLSWLSEASSWARVLSCKETRKARMWRFSLLELGWALPVSESWKVRSLQMYETLGRGKKKKIPPKSALAGIGTPRPSVTATEMCQAFPLNYTDSPAAWLSLEKGIDPHWCGQMQEEILFSPNTVLDQT